MRNSTLPPRKAYIKRGKPPRRKTAPKPLSDKTVSKLKKDLDKIVSEYVRLSEDYICFVCGKACTVKWSIGNPDAAECGHLFTRSAEATRFDITPDGNNHCQCHMCNMIHGGANMRFKVTVEQWPYYSAYIEKFGQQAFDDLRVRSKVSTRWKAWKIEELIEETRIALEQLKAEKGGGGHADD